LAAGAGADDPELLDSEEWRTSLPHILDQQYGKLEKTVWEAFLAQAADAAWRRVGNQLPDRQLEELRKLGEIVVYSPRYADARQAYLASPEHAIEEAEALVAQSTRDITERLRQASAELATAKAKAAIKNLGNFEAQIAALKEEAAKLRG
jgi:hypothetical protein